MPGFVVVCRMLSNGDVMYRLFLLVGEIGHRDKRQRVRCDSLDEPHSVNTYPKKM